MVSLNAADLPLFFPSIFFSLNAAHLPLLRSRWRPFQPWLISLYSARGGGHSSHGSACRSEEPVAPGRRCTSTGCLPANRHTTSSLPSPADAPSTPSSALARTDTIVAESTCGSRAVPSAITWSSSRCPRAPRVRARERGHQAGRSAHESTRETNPEPYTQLPTDPGTLHPKPYAPHPKRTSAFPANPSNPNPLTPQPQPETLD